MKTVALAAALAACGLALATPTEAEARGGSRGHVSHFRSGPSRPPAFLPTSSRSSYFVGRLVRRAAPVIRRVARVAAPIVPR